MAPAALTPLIPSRQYPFRQMDHDVTVSPRTRKRRWPWIVALTVAGVLVAAAGAGGAYLFSLTNTYNAEVDKLEVSEAFPDVSVRPAPVDQEHDGARNILLLGSDTRGQLADDIDGVRGQRSDTMMVVHVPASGESVQVMSIMRDNWVEIPGHGEHKINAAMALGGVPLTVQTIESIIDVRIDHVAIVDFEGLAGLTDALGGVTVDNPKAFKSFAQGPITLDGASALSYVRERYAFSDGDYQRVRNQQAFIKGLISTVLSRDTLTDPGRISGMVGAIAPYLTVDEGLDVATVTDLGLRLSNLRADDIVFFTSPNLGTGMVGDQSVVFPDWNALDDLAQAFRTDTVDTFVAQLNDG